MSERLLAAFEGLFIRKGTQVYTDLGAILKKSPKTVRRWIKDGVPNSHDGYMLALACGCSEADALEIAKECSAQAKDTA